jgi:hypothetical protein
MLSAASQRGKSRPSAVVKLAAEAKPAQDRVSALAAGGVLRLSHSIRGCTL